MKPFIRFILLSLIGMISLHVSAQTFTPIAYWTFEQSMADVSGSGHPLNLNTATPNYQTTSGIVGTHLMSGPGSHPGISNLDMPYIDESISVEFWLKTSRNFTQARFFTWNKLWIDLRPNQIFISVKTSSNATLEFEVPLDGIDRKDPNYIYDGGWHHYAAVFDSKIGETRLYIDGYSLEGFVKYWGTTMPLQADNGANYLSQWQSSFYGYQGAIDEIAWYDQPIPAALVWQHYQEGLSGQHYSPSLSITSVPPPPRGVEGILNPMDFSPGYPNTPDSSVHLLAGFPRPRFRPTDSLPPSLPWISDIHRLATSYSNNTPPGATMLVHRQAAQMLKMYAQDFGFYLELGIANGARLAANFFPDGLYTQIAEVADSFPDLKRFMLTNWFQVNNQALNPIYPPGSAVFNTGLPADYYPRDSTNNHAVVTHSFWSWAGPNRPGPAARLRVDGQVNGWSINHYLPHLAVDRIDMIGENGETLHRRGLPDIERDTSMQRERARLGLPWAEYQSFGANRMGQIYYAGALDSLLPKWGTAPKFYYYNVNGGTPGFAHYSYIRELNSSIQGRRRASPQLYPNGAWRWRFGSFTYFSLQQTMDGLDNQYAQGDSLICPAVSPGFNDGGVFFSNDAYHMRPGQYLGWLKVLMMLGADNFNCFEFEGQNSPFQGNWRAWKLVPAGYTQAITGRAQAFLYNGRLMNGDAGSYINGSGYTNRYVLPTGNSQHMVMARKLNGQPRYLIMGTCQRLSNEPSAGQLSANVCVAPDTTAGVSEVWLQIRQQGSTYLLDDSQPDPVLVQLDTWHEWKYPTYWCRHFRFEAEVHDNLPPNLVTRTRKAPGATRYDFRNHRTYVTFTAPPSPGQGLQFGWKDRAAEDSLYVFVLARNRSTASSIQIRQDGLPLPAPISIPADTNWHWYHLTAASAKAVLLNLSVGSHVLELLPASTGIDIDQVALLRAFYPLEGSSLVLTASADTVCAGTPTHFVASSSMGAGCVDYTWDFGDGTRAMEQNPAHSYRHPGVYDVTLVALEQCSGAADTLAFQVLVRGPLVDAGADTTVCAGKPVLLVGQGSVPVQWLPATGLAISSTAPDQATATVGGFFYLQGSDGAGCTLRDSIRVNPVAMNVTWNDTLYIQYGQSIRLNVRGGYHYLWEPGPTLIDSTAWNPLVHPSYDHQYDFATWDACNCDTVYGSVMVIVCGTGQPLSQPLSSNWSGTTTGGHWEIADTLTIDASITFTNSVFYMGTGAAIRVMPGKQLTTNGCRMKGSCSGEMWQGIILEDGSTVYNSTNDTIRDAERGIWSKSGARFTVVNNRFEANWVGIHVDGQAGQHLGTVVGSSFLASGGLRSPHQYAPAPFSGIQIDLVEDIVIGQASGSANLFDGLQHGIRAVDSRIQVYQNTFQNLYHPGGLSNPDGIGAGVWASASSVEPNYRLRVEVGHPSTVSPPILSASANTFSNCAFGVWVEKPHEVTVRGNTVSNSAFTGIFVREQQDDSLLIARNTLTSNATAIHLGLINQNPALVEWNTVSGQMALWGIRVDIAEYPNLDNLDGVYGMQISDNSLQVRRDGFICQASDHVDFDWNTVHLLPNTGGGIYRGVYLNSCRVTRVTNNEITSTLAAAVNANVKGCYTYYSPETQMNCNTLRDLGQHVVWDDFCRPSSFLNNTMQNGVDALVLVDKGEIGVQGNFFVPSDNRWYGTFSHAQTLARGDSTDGSNSALYARQTTYFNPTVNLVSGFALSPVQINSAQNGSNTAIACAKREDDNGDKSSTVTAVATSRSAGADDLDAAYQWRKDEWAYAYLLEAPEAFSNNPAVLAFEDTCAAKQLDDHLVAALALRERDSLCAQAAHPAITGEVPSARNHAELMEVRLALDLPAAERITRLQALGQQCERLGGKAVTVARSLLHVAGMPVPEDPGCGADKRGEAQATAMADMAACFPNPSDGHLNVRVLTPFTTASLRVEDMAGRTLLLADLHHSVSRLTLPPTAQGMVLVRLYLDGIPAQTWQVALQR